MKYLLLLLLISCGSVRQDTSPAPIEEGQKRVETIICDSHSVGENGCTYNEGVISGTLKIYKVYAGSVQIIGTGCGVDFSTNYERDGQEWLNLDLISLVGDRLSTDCVLTVLQKIKYPYRETEFPIKSMTGTVTLGFCPDGINCKMSFEQVRLSQLSSPFVINEEPEGMFMLAGCGRDLIKPTDFSGSINLDLKPFLPSTKNSGCMFIAGVRGVQLHKIYRKVWQYSDRVINMKAPTISLKGGKVCYNGDEFSIASSVNGQFFKGPVGSFKPSRNGDTVRFFTSQGRSLVVFIKDGKVVWTK